jgi:glucose/arabinose dehydrogenase
VTPAIVAAGVLLAAACSGDDRASDATTTTATATSTTTTAAPPPGVPAVALEEVVTDLQAPVGLVSPPGDDRLFVLERFAGTIRVIEDGQLADEPFLDLRDRLVANGEDEPEEMAERGLLSLAFHPDYAANGRFFVYYADLSGHPELLEYRASDDPARADPGSAVVLHEYSDSRMHFGGSLGFAPDGALWLSIGDGLRSVAATDTANVRGSILRYDVSTPGQAVAAAGNPYLGDDPGADEVWAKGLRNPWRVALDAESGLAFVADVGATTAEEISVVPLDAAGLDFGWPAFEAGVCSEPPDCDATGTVEPAVELLRDDGVCAVIGGVVYRGTAIPELDGAYLYTDYCAGFLRSFRFVDGEVVDEHELLTDIGSIAAFGTDAAGEVYLVEQPTGTVYKIVPAG